MEVRKIKIELGLEKPVNVAHFTDVHISMADERDEHLIKHAEARADVFYREAEKPDKTPSEFLKEALAYADKNCDISVITGDMIDFISEKNLDEAKSILDGHKYMFTAGNHEFCPQVGISDSFARKLDEFCRIQSYFDGNMYFESKVIGGVNLVTVDNSYYNYCAPQIKALEKEIEKGLPIIIFSHVPLTEKMLNLVYHHKDLVPDKYMMEQTKKMLELINSCELIKAEFSGHWHVEVDTTTDGGIPEYVTPGLFKGKMTHIEIV